MTVDDLVNKLVYNPDTGLFTWKNSGKEAGWNKDGYKRIGKLQLYAHRLAWYIMTGEWVEEIDHINKIRNDNRWCNLREADHTGNCRNINAKKHNKTGVLHVHIHKSGGYDVRIGKYFRKWIKDFEGACEVAQQKRKEFYGEYA